MLAHFETNFIMQCYRMQGYATIQQTVVLNVDCCIAEVGLERALEHREAKQLGSS